MSGILHMRTKNKRQNAGMNTRKRKRNTNTSTRAISTNINTTREKIEMIRLKVVSLQRKNPKLQTNS